MIVLPAFVMAFEMNAGKAVTGFNAIERGIWVTSRTWLRIEEAKKTLIVCADSRTLTGTDGRN
jgi:hypothetical protein